MERAVRAVLLLRYKFVVFVERSLLSLNVNIFIRCSGSISGATSFVRSLSLTRCKSLSAVVSTNA